jgi:hypothetical protein
MILLFQFAENLVDIASMGKTEHDFKFSKLDVNWVVVLAEEDFHIVLEDIWSFLDNQ